MRKRSNIACRTLSLFVVGLLVLQPRPSAADQIVVMTSGGFTAPYLALVAEFQRVSKHTLVTATTTIGVGAESIPNRLQRREPADVVIAAEGSIDAMIAAGTVVAGSRVALARSSIGMAVRAGAPTPDVSTVAGFIQTLLRARSVAHSGSVSGQYLVNEVYPRLGIADQLEAKSQLIERERVGAVVARGDAEIGFQQVSELLPVPGIQLLGPLPPEIQRVTVFTAGVAVHSRHPDAARALIAFLASPAAVGAIEKSGMEPMPAR